MSLLTLKAKGRVTLTQDLLKHLNIAPGEKIGVRKLPGGRLEMQAERVTGSISDLFGALKRDGGPSLTIGEINEVIAQGWAGKR